MKQQLWSVSFESTSVGFAKSSPASLVSAGSKLPQGMGNRHIWQIRSVSYVPLIFFFCVLSSQQSCCRERRELLIKCAATSLNSKLISHQKDFFAPIVVDAVLSLDEDLSLDMIGVKKIPGGALEVRPFLAQLCGHLTSLIFRILFL